MVTSRCLLSSRCPRSEIPCLPHKITVSAIDFNFSLLCAMRSARMLDGCWSTGTCFLSITALKFSAFFNSCQMVFSSWLLPMHVKCSRSLSFAFWRLVSGCVTRVPVRLNTEEEPGQAECSICNTLFSQFMNILGHCTERTSCIGNSSFVFRMEQLETRRKH